jgi:hypothetical protein
MYRERKESENERDVYRKEGKQGGGENSLIPDVVYMAATEFRPFCDVCNFPLGSKFHLRSLLRDYQGIRGKYRVYSGEL